MKFICDEMLTGLGHWLRIAGFDTTIVKKGTTDSEIIKQVKASNYFFLTCDAELSQRMSDYPNKLHLQSSNIEACIKELNQHLSIDWTSHAFERCSVCNTVIHPANKKQIALEKIDLSKNHPIYYCTNCDKLYWEGSHVKRMRKRLLEFQSL